MRSLVRASGALFGAALLALVAVEPLAAQGITTASVRGRVVDDAGAPVEGATVTLSNTSTGQQYQTVSRGDGRYNLENVAVGGPYELQARRIGYQAARRTGITLTLNQVLSFDIVLAAAAVELEAVIVTGAREQDPLTAPSRTGTAAFVSDSAIRRLPTLNRNFTDFIATVPQVATIGEEIPSLGGGHNRMNNVQIDGVSDNDLFGLGATGQPGGQVDAKSITLEAVKEYQVLVAPFDVRQSGFHGGVVNAITKGGTNEYHGSAFWYFQDDALVRDTLVILTALGDTLRFPFGEYRQHQRGFSLGGPIVPDRVHFFGAGEWQTRDTPSQGETIKREPESLHQIAVDSAQRVVDILRDVYGVNAGSYEAFTIENPNRNFFGRLDFQLGDNHTLTVRHNYVKATSDLGISRSPFSYEFSSAGYTIKNETNSSVLQLNSNLGGGRLFNELRLGYLRIRDARDPVEPFAALLIDNDSCIGGTGEECTGGKIFGNRLSVGAERFSQRNRLKQDVWELTNDLTFARGRHTFTLGTHNELIAFDNIFFHTSIGQWRFASLADLEAGKPFEYFVQIPFPGVTDANTAGRADWSLLQLGGYLQDQWEATPALRVTLGVRLDVPIVNDSPKENDPLAGATAFDPAIETDVVPSGNLHWAPRLGFNWDVTGDRGTVVRGGGGLFTGRPAYVWFSNAFTNTGRDIVTVTCTAKAKNLPPFNSTTIGTPPQDCVGVSGIRVPRSQVNYFDADFQFPQQLKASLALDQRLPGGLIGTLEFLYTKGINTIYQQEMNIPQTALQTNAEGRQLFGDPAKFTGGNIPPTRRDTSFAHILRHTNRSEDRAYAFTAQLQKRFSAGYEFSAGYTYQNVKDLTSLGSSIASSNFGFSPVSRGGNPSEKELTTSRFDVPHRIVLSGTVNLPIPSLPSALTLLYTGQSGTPFSWHISGDANGDGYRAPEIGSRDNDIVYVPLADGSDFTPDNTDAVKGDLARYNALIELQPCLVEARGSIPERNTCRNPWRNRLDANVRVSLGGALGGRRHNLTLVADVFNVLNLLNSDWGVQRQVSFFETRNALLLRSYDKTNDRGKYRYIGPNVLPAAGGDPDNLEGVIDLASRYRLQVALRYDF